LLAARFGAAAGSELADAAMKRNLPAVRSLLAQKADVNAAQQDGATALHWAVHFDDVDMVDLLVRSGANVKAANRFGVTPLALACINGNAAVVERLLKAGADANTVLTELGETPLMLAARTGSGAVIKVLLENGANVNATESTKGQTALMWAASERHAAAVKVLVEHGADVNARSKITTTQGRGLYDGAAPAPPASTPAEEMALKKAQSESNADARLALLADFEQQFPKSRLLLDVYQDMIKIYQAKNDPANEKLVREKLVPIERQQRQPAPRGPVVSTGGITALMLAARENSLESAEILVAAGADPNLALANGSGPLLLAILNGHYQVASFLLNHGADPNHADKDGKAALYATVDMRNLATTDTPGPAADKAEALELIQTLLTRGANPNARLTARPQFRGGANRTWLSEPGATPFYRAAVSGDVNAMRLLLAYGADPYIATNDNTTPLMVAAGIGYLVGSTFAWPERDALDAIKLCLELGNVNAANDAGQTALHGAAFRGWNAAVQTLVDHGANLSVKDKQGRTPMVWADGIYRGGGIAPVRQAQTVALFQRLIGK
jgi:ankyrin